VIALYGTKVSLPQHYQKPHEHTLTSYDEQSIFIIKFITRTVATHGHSTSQLYISKAIVNVTLHYEGIMIRDDGSRSL
jgi:hypothetical protein